MTLTIVLILGILAIVLMRSSVYLHIDYIKNNRQDELELTVYLFGYWKIYQQVRRDCASRVIKEIIGKFLPEKNECALAESKTEKYSAPKNKKISWRQMTKLPWVCRKMSLMIKISSDDAAQTAISFGVIHVLKSLLYRWVRHKISFKSPPQFRLEPGFHHEEKELLLQCIISTKIGNIIYILKNSAKGSAD